MSELSDSSCVAKLTRRSTSYHCWISMKLSRDSLPFLICFIALAFFHFSQAQNSQEDYLAAHNAARSKVGVGSMTWDNTVATYAQNYTNQRAGDCNLMHSGGSYGENLAWSSSDMSATDAMNEWVIEKTYYDYNSNSCTEGQQCGHYIKVV